MKRIALCVAGAVLASCASKSSDIEPSYVSSTLYQNLTCQQLVEEAGSVSARAVAASQAQDKKANQDAAATAVGIVIFWPTLFLTQGNGAKAAEVSRLKGEMLAIEQASLKNNCGIKFSKS